MMLLRNLPLRLLIAVFALSSIAAGCKKSEISSAEWGEKAMAKRNEILKLASNIPCSEQANVSIMEISDGCSVAYYTILQADLQKYEALKKEYDEYTGKQYAAWSREGLIVDPCSDALWALEQPIRIDCENNKVKLITSANVGIQEAKLLVNDANLFISNFLNAQTCTEEASWAYTNLINYEALNTLMIPYSRTSDNKEFKREVSLYNRLNLRIAESEGNLTAIKRGKLVDRVECKNGKPVIKFRD